MARLISIFCCVEINTVYEYIYTVQPYAYGRTVWVDRTRTVWTPYGQEQVYFIKWAASSEFVSSSIPSWQILTAHAQLFRGARDLAFCLKVPLDSLLVWATSGGPGETARMRRLAWTFAARIGHKYQIRLTRPKFETLTVILTTLRQNLIGPRQANLVLIAYASSEGSGEPAHPRSLARTFAARSYKQWVKRNLQTESQIPGPSEWLGMRS